MKIRCIVKVALKDVVSKNINNWGAWTGIFSDLDIAEKHAIKYFSDDSYYDKYQFGLFQQEKKPKAKWQFVKIINLKGKR